MKRTYIVLCCLILASLGRAQLPSEDQLVEPDRIKEITQALPGNNTANKALQNELYKAGGDTLWYEDFSNGFPTTWTLQDSSGNCPWTYTLDGTWGYWNSNNGTGPGDDTLQSVTMSNGFLICDPDSANNALYGQPSGTTYQYLSSYFTTDAIDLTGFPGVSLEFEHLYRFNNGIDLEVAVSADGTNWTTYSVQGITPNNTQSANAETAKINISLVAGNQATVYIRIGWSARVYYWMIDDIRIIRAAANDLTAITEQHYPFYKMTPVRQVTDITFTGEILNNGENTQTNVKLNAAVTNSGAVTPIGSSSAVSTSAPGNTDLFTILDSSYIPQLIGDYSVAYYATSDSTDSDPNDDTIFNTFRVSDTVYARDNDVYTGSGVRTSTTGTSKRGIMYQIWQQDTLTSMSVLISERTPSTGQLIQFHLYDTSLSFPLASSTFHTITSGDQGQWVTISFTDFPLPPGQYIAVVESFSDSVYVHYNPNAPLPLPQTAFYLSSGGNWYYSTNYTYFVRMNTKRPACDAEITVTTSNSTCGASDADASASVSGGFLPYAYSWNTNPPQSSNAATGLSAGVYFLTINDALGCSYTETTIIVDVGSATLTTSSTDVTAIGASDGTASVTASGGSPPFTYSWSNGVNDPALTNLVAGTYNVTVEGADNCVSAASITIMDPLPLTMLDISRDKLIIYPNPTTGIVYVKFNDELIHGVEIAVFDILGGQILKETTSNKEFFLDLSKYKPGVYFLQIKTSDRLIARKIIVSN